jgi:hypothetical protein
MRAIAAAVAAADRGTARRYAACGALDPMALRRLTTVPNHRTVCVAHGLCGECHRDTERAMRRARPLCDQAI